MTVSLTRTPLVTRQDMRKVVQEENPGVTFGEVGKLLGAKWQEADEKTKKACARPVCASHAARCTRARRFAGSGGCSLPLHEGFALGRLPRPRLGPLGSRIRRPRHPAATAGCVARGQGGGRAGRAGGWAPGDVGRPTAGAQGPPSPALSPSHAVSPASWACAEVRRPGRGRQEALRARHGRVRARACAAQRGWDGMPSRVV